MSVTKINSYYGNQHVVRDVSIELKPNSVTAIVGVNGAGKTTLLRTLIGRQKQYSMSIVLNGQTVVKQDPISLFKMGMVLCPEGREVFSSLTVEENLKIGLVRKRLSKVETERRFEEIYDLFPKLKDRLRQNAGTLSGGEQQMLALGRAFISKPTVILLDEPFLGLAPVIISELLDAIRNIASNGAAILMAEQHVSSVRLLTSNILIMENGVLKHDD